MEVKYIRCSREIEPQLEVMARNGALTSISRSCSSDYLQQCLKVVYGVSEVTCTMCCPTNNLCNKARNIRISGDHPNLSHQLAQDVHPVRNRVDSQEWHVRSSKEVNLIRRIMLMKLLRQW